MFGTCAGMILLSSTIDDGRADQHALAAIDITVRRNGYGRQRQSFETDITLVDDQNFHGVFIRAPRVTEVGSAVAVLAVHDGDPVLLEQGPILVASFHPELTTDPAVHRLFLERTMSTGLTS